MTIFCQVQVFQVHLQIMNCASVEITANSLVVDACKHRARCYGHQLKR